MLALHHGASALGVRHGLKELASIAETAENLKEDGSYAGHGIFAGARDGECSQDQRRQIQRGCATAPPQWKTARRHRRIVATRPAGRQRAPSDAGRVLACPCGSNLGQYPKGGQPAPLSLFGVQLDEHACSRDHDPRDERG
jgi:hypothetical protein